VYTSNLCLNGPLYQERELYPKPVYPVNQTFRRAVAKHTGAIAAYKVTNAID